MKIFIVSDFAIDEKDSCYYYGESFKRIWLKNGKNKIQSLNCRNKFIVKLKEWIEKKINGVVKPLFLLGASAAEKIILNILFIKSFLSFKPNIIFFIKGHKISYLALKYCLKKYPAKAFNYYPDSPFSVYNNNSSVDILMSLPFYEKFFIWTDSYHQSLMSAGAKKVETLPFFPDQTIFPQKAIPLKSFDFDISFIGAWDEKREAVINFIKTSHPKIKIFIAGPNWESSSLTPSTNLIITYKPINTEEAISICQKSKISLNILKNQNVDSHNMRTFEIPSSQGFVLGEYSKEQALFFKPKLQAEYFKDLEELSEKIKYYLKNETQREVVRLKGFKKSKQFCLSKQISKIIE